MRKSLFCWLGTIAVAVIVAVPASWADGKGKCGPGKPVIGLDGGAAIPVSTFQDTADVGGAVAPFIGYQFGDTFAVTPIIQPQLAFFPTADTKCGCYDDVTSLFSITGGARLSLNDENKEVYFSAQGGWYTDIEGPLNDEDAGWNIGAGFNYEFRPGTALGVFVRRDESEMRAARGSNDNLEFLVSGVSLRHRFLPPAVAPPPPPPPPQVAVAPAPPPVKKKIILRGVNFAFDKSSISEEARPILDEAVATLKEYGSVRVSVDGHTDSIGSEEYNDGLSMRRATAVRDYLEERGIAGDRMTIAGHGESEPVASNSTREGRAQNRRVELRIIDQQS